jgi:hypothetical protein
MLNPVICVCPYRTSTASTTITAIAMIVRRPT